jgi:adenine-specific DNA methylase
VLAELQQKKLGAYYTPPHVAQTLVRWVVRDAGDRLLDPSCGDGRFLAGHRNSVGVDCDVTGVVAASQGNRHSTIHVSGFFEWASTCRERFDCVAGNPPFIRYQHFVGRERELALQHCARLGARFTALTSSWAPFLVVAASLLKPNGRLAFVVPAEIGHAPYAAPLLEYLTRNFGKVQVVAIEKKLFPELSEDAWLLYAEGFSGSSNALLLTQRETFTCTSSPPRDHTAVTKVDLARWNGRLRPFLLPHDARNMYERLSESSTVVRLKEVARVGIGYVTGANDYFHFRPSTARFVGIPGRYLLPTVRNGRALPTGSLTSKTVERWLKRDEPVLHTWKREKEVLRITYPFVIQCIAGWSQRRHRRPLRQNICVSTRMVIS